MRLLAALSLALVAGFAHVTTASETPDVQRAEPALTLDEVLESTRIHYPPLLAAILEIEAAEGELLDSQGKFDANIFIGGNTTRIGFYESERFDVGIEQAIQTWGAKLYAGWRIGQGNFAPYDGLLETRDGGEYSVGIKLPLLRDRAIDRNRAALQQNEIGITLAGLSVAEQQLFIRNLATVSYWDWVATGQALLISQSLLDIALDREEFLTEGVDAGAIARIELTDNRRAILKRRSELVSAEQKVRKAAIYLSLYYRDQFGEPVLPPESRLPTEFPEPRPLEPGQLDLDLELAETRRPEILAVRAQAEQVRIDERLALNAFDPAMDLGVGLTSENGINPDVKRGPTDLKIGVTFDFPVQMRSAEGKLLKARAKLGQLQRKEQFLGEKIRAEVRDAAIALDASYRKLQFLEEEVIVTRELEALERERFDLGDSNLFTVNLREAATADAEVRRVQALSDYQRARALYDLVTAAP